MIKKRFCHLQNKVHTKKTNNPENKTELALLHLLYLSGKYCNSEQVASTSFNKHFHHSAIHEHTNQDLNMKTLTSKSLWLNLHCLMFFIWMQCPSFFNKSHKTIFSRVSFKNYVCLMFFVIYSVFDHKSCFCAIYNVLYQICDITIVNNKTNMICDQKTLLSSTNASLFHVFHSNAISYAVSWYSSCFSFGNYIFQGSLQ